MANKQPIFVNSYPRVGSTWFASKLMEQLGERHFHEPLHPMLLDATQQSAEANFEKLRRGKSLRHPPRGQNYFFNYPLRKKGGVEGFQERFCYANYVLTAGEKDSAFRAYWQRLLKHARSDGRQCSFKDTSTPLRQGWMKNNLGGTQIYLVQHPRLTDKSYFSFRGFNNPYSREFSLAAALNRNHPGLKKLFDWMAIDPPADNTTMEQGLAHYSRLFAATPAKRDPRFTRQFHYNIFCFFWLAGLAQASRHADVIVDLEVLRDVESRNWIENDLKSKTGLALDLSDYYPKTSKHTVGEENFRLTPGMVRVLRNALPYFEPDWPRLDRLPLSAATRRAVDVFGYGKRPIGSIISNLFTEMPQTS